jgi:DNA polymerase-3 subunit epsilon
VTPRGPLRVIRASDQELDAHRERLRAIDESSDGGCIWRQLESD